MRKTVLVVAFLVLIATWIWWRCAPDPGPIDQTNGRDNALVVENGPAIPSPPNGLVHVDTTKPVWPDRGHGFPPLPGYPDATGLWNFDPKLRPNGTFATDGVETDPDVWVGISPRNQVEERRTSEERGIFGHPEKIDRRWLPIEFWVRVHGRSDWIGSPPFPDQIAANVSFRVFKWKTGAKAEEVSSNHYRIARGVGLKVVEVKGESTQAFEVSLLYAFETDDPELLSGAVVALEAYLDIRGVQGKPGLLAVRSWAHPFQIVVARTEDDEANAYWWRLATIRAKEWDAADRDLFPLYIEMAQRWPNSFKVNAQLGEVCYHLRREEDAVHYLGRALDLLARRSSDEPGTTAEISSHSDEALRALKEPYAELLTRIRRVLDGLDEPWRYPSAQ